MPQTINTLEKKPVTGILHGSKPGPGSTEALTREGVLQKLKNKEFIADQLKHIARAK